MRAPTCPSNALLHFNLDKHPGRGWMAVGLLRREAIHLKRETIMRCIGELPCIYYIVPNRCALSSLGFLAIFYSDYVRGLCIFQCAMMRQILKAWLHSSMHLIIVSRFKWIGLWLLDVYPN